jgi:hypothetical protein
VDKPQHWSYFKNSKNKLLILTSISCKIITWKYSFSKFLLTNFVKIDCVFWEFNYSPLRFDQSQFEALSLYNWLFTDAFLSLLPHNHSITKGPRMKPCETFWVTGTNRLNFCKIISCNKLCKVLKLQNILKKNSEKPFNTPNLLLNSSYKVAFIKFFAALSSLNYDLIHEVFEFWNFLNKNSEKLLKKSGIKLQSESYYTFLGSSNDLILKVLLFKKLLKIILKIPCHNFCKIQAKARDSWVAIAIWIPFDPQRLPRVQREIDNNLLCGCKCGIKIYKHFEYSKNRLPLYFGLYYYTLL